MQLCSSVALQLCSLQPPTGHVPIFSISLHPRCIGSTSLSHPLPLSLFFPPLPPLSECANALAILHHMMLLDWQSYLDRQRLFTNTIRVRKTGRHCEVQSCKPGSGSDATALYRFAFGCSLSLPPPALSFRLRATSAVACGTGVQKCNVRGLQALIARRMGLCGCTGGRERG